MNRCHHGFSASWLQTQEKDEKTWREPNVIFAKICQRNCLFLDRGLQTIVELIALTL